MSNWSTKIEPAPGKLSSKTQKSPMSSFQKLSLKKNLSPKVGLKWNPTHATIESSMLQLDLPLKTNGIWNKAKKSGMKPTNSVLRSSMNKRKERDRKKLVSKPKWERNLTSGSNITATDSTTDMKNRLMAGKKERIPTLEHTEKTQDRGLVRKAKAVELLTKTMTRRATIPSFWVRNSTTWLNYSTI